MITLRNIVKQFDTYANPADRFKEFFVGGRADSFRALDDVSLDIEPGQTVGIIGPNGSGKSTVLQIMAGILFPTSGTVEVEGKVSALLELGAGFNPDFTGRENVYLNASILGMTQSEIDAKFKNIVEFSGIGDFVNRPVKTYSSGMYVRLAFATAINVDPDILIIDEALAVGDVAFQQKCMMKLKQLQGEGKTIIFVSHDTSAVKSLCDHAILMHHGQVIDRGSPEHIVNHYLKLVYSETLASVTDDTTSKSLEDGDKQELTPVKTVPNIEQRFGNQDASILGVVVLDENGRATSGIESGDELRIKVSVECNKTIENPIIGVVIRDRLGNDLTATNTFLEGNRLEPGGPGDILTALFAIKIPEFSKGHYSISPAIANGTLTNHDMCDWIDNAYTFEVINPRTVFGMMRFPAEVTYSAQRS